MGKRSDTDMYRRRKRIGETDRQMMATECVSEGRRMMVSE